MTNAVFPGNEELTSVACIHAAIVVSVWGRGKRSSACLVLGCFHCTYFLPFFPECAGWVCVGYPSWDSVATLVIITILFILLLYYSLIFYYLIIIFISNKLYFTIILLVQLICKFSAYLTGNVILSKKNMVNVTVRGRFSKCFPSWPRANAGQCTLPFYLDISRMLSPDQWSTCNNMIINK